MQEYDKNIVRNAVIKLFKETGLYFTIDFNDNKILIALEQEGYSLIFHGEFKRNVTKESLGSIKEQLDKIRTDKPVILITHYVNPVLIEKIKELGINIIDMAGNAFINYASIFVYIKGNKIYEPIKLMNPGKAFEQKGLQVIYALLCKRDLIERPYREIAALSKTSVGTVFNIIDYLERTNFIIDKGKEGKTLINKEELLRKWTTYYPDKLKPKLFLRKFRIEDKNWQDMKVKEFGGLWGGEPAAAAFTNYLKPNLYTIYVDDEVNNLIFKNKMKPDITGNIELFYKFWKFTDEYNEEGYVHPILIYTDLLATGDQRNIETAKILYEQKIIGYLK